MAAPIARSLRADLLLVEGDPAGNTLTTRSIVGIWKHGVRLDRQAFRKALKGAGGP